MINPATRISTYFSRTDRPDRQVDYRPKQNRPSRTRPQRERRPASRIARLQGLRRRWQEKLLLGLLLSLLAAIGFIGARYWWQEYRWRFIVIHHSASPIGNLEYIRRIHMEERGWSSIAYHFVVDNGSMNTTIGQVEVANLWKQRLPNLSTRNEYINTFGIAVVMVGNFQNDPVPELQFEALIHLLVELARRYDIPPERIIGHREVQQTACPGRHLDLDLVRAKVEAELLRPNASGR